MQRTLFASVRAALAVTVFLSGASPAPAQSLDYEFFRSRVEPIFLTKRAGHVRCYVCHSGRSNNSFKLEKLSLRARSSGPRSSRRNFEVVSRLVTAEEAGGAVILGGGVF